MSTGLPPGEFLEFILPANDPPIQVPITINRLFTSAWDEFRLAFEGTGPADTIRIVGTATWTGPVPEPSTIAIALAALPLAYLTYRRRTAVR